MAFFNHFLLPEHTGERLRLPTEVLQGQVQNYITPAQLAYIVKRFPNVEIEALTLCLADDDNVKEAGESLSHFLKKGKIRKLTIASERLRDPHHSEQLGKLLTKSERRARSEDWGDYNWDRSPFHYRFSSQVMELLKHLKGEIPVLIFQLLPAKADNQLNSHQILKMLAVPPPQEIAPSHEEHLPRLKITYELRFQQYHERLYNDNPRRVLEATPFLQHHVLETPPIDSQNTLIEKAPAQKEEEQASKQILLIAPPTFIPKMVDSSSLEAQEDTPKELSLSQ